MIRALVNGDPNGCIPLDDRGVLYGDGLFETIRIVHGQPDNWDGHMRRLRRGCTQLRLPTPPVALLRQEIDHLASGQHCAIARVQLTLAGGERGYKRPAAGRFNRILTLHELLPLPARCYETGVTVRWCHFQLADHSGLSGIKHLNRLEQVMARAEWDDVEIFDGLLTDQRGRVIGGTMSNLFLIQKGELLTPDVFHAGVAGTMRERVFRAARELGLHATETPVTPEMCQQADGLFLTNAVRGIVPVSRLEQQSFDRHDLTAQVMENLQEPPSAIVCRT